MIVLSDSAEINERCNVDTLEDILLTDTRALEDPRRPEGARRQHDQALGKSNGRQWVFVRTKPFVRDIFDPDCFRTPDIT